MLAGSGTDVDGTVAAYSLGADRRSGGDALRRQCRRPGFTAPCRGRHGARLRADRHRQRGRDRPRQRRRATVRARPNQPPVANAGPDQTVTAGESVTLAGSGTDVDGTIVSYAWTQVSGPAVTLSGATTATATFRAGGECSRQPWLHPPRHRRSRCERYRPGHGDGAAHFQRAAHRRCRGQPERDSGTRSRSPAAPPIPTAPWSPSSGPRRRGPGDAPRRQHGHGALHGPGGVRQHRAHLPAHRHGAPGRERQRPGLDHGRSESAPRGQRRRRPGGGHERLGVTLAGAVSDADGTIAPYSGPRRRGPR